MKVFLTLMVDWGHNAGYTMGMLSQVNDNSQNRPAWESFGRFLRNAGLLESPKSRIAAGFENREALDRLHHSIVRPSGAGGVFSWWKRLMPFAGKGKRGIWWKRSEIAVQVQ